MLEDPRTARVTHCSFCGRPSRETGAHVEGPGDVYVCERCVGVASDIFADARAKRGVGPEQMGGPRPPAAAQQDWVRCSFCGAQRPAAGPMLEGPSGIHLCLACVDQAARLAKEVRGRGEG